MIVAIVGGMFVDSATLQLASADVIFSESFDNPSASDGRVLYDAADVYDGIDDPLLSGGDSAGNAFENGLIVQSYIDRITADQSDSGYFLHNRTGGSATDFLGEVWGTSTHVAVASGRLYEFSFYLTNENDALDAVLQLRINGVAMGSPISAEGTFETDGWQRFTVQWDSGAADSADLSLVNTVSHGGGNDFGIDSIEFANVPEPSAVVLVLTTAGSVILFQRRPRACPPSSPCTSGNPALRQDSPRQH